ncbi:hypothetical protein IQ07DRAFT_592258 [Pyrenochaeta sp. DS3sAY3a]|nr:hypothetical protein IQ07DRAFT_592258 [Pyrenochaeta sp. DS3sAY3a]
MSVKTPTTSCLLDLPAELRLLIYDKIGRRTEPSNFTNLLLTCKALYNELEPDICKAFAKTVEGIAASIRADGDEIIYTPPTTLHGWLNLTVSRPKRAYMFRENDCYMHFQYIYFHRFTITFHNDSEGFEQLRGIPTTYQAAASRLAVRLSGCYDVDAYPAMKRWVLDWAQFPHADAIKRMHHPLTWFNREAWTMDTYKNAEGLLTGVCFRRAPKGPRKPEKKVDACEW